MREDSTRRTLHLDMESETNSAISSQLFSDPNYDWDQAVIDALDTSLDESQRKAIERSLETDVGKMDFVQPEPTYSIDMGSVELQCTTQTETPGEVAQTNQETDGNVGCF